MSTQIAKNETLLNSVNFKLNLNDLENSYSSSTNNIKNILIEKKETKVGKRHIDRFGDLTEIIKNNIISKSLLENNKAKSHKKNKNKPVLLILNSPKKQKKKQNNIKFITYTNSATKDSSQISLNSNYIKNNHKINLELFINKKTINNKNKSNTFGKKETIEKKKFDINLMVNRVEEELQKAKKQFESKKEKIREKEKKIYSGKPNTIKSNSKNYQKYLNDFLVRQKELNEELNKKKKKLIDEVNQKKEEEYQKIISKNILNKNKKNYIKNKSFDDWVERLSQQKTAKRQIEQYYLEQSILPSFKPFIPKKDIKKVIKGDENQIDKVIKKYNEKTNPEIIINYLNKKKIYENQNLTLIRNKIFAKPKHKYINKKINNSMQ